MGVRAGSWESAPTFVLMLPAISGSMRIYDFW